ncbi:hypothetical protein HDV00_009563 [Rhizophlyctis rosea]|nr:hypothetical protein HDV00_009563 [Rhizophlyctis rosea]
MPSIFPAKFKNKNKNDTHERLAEHHARVANSNGDQDRHELSEGRFKKFSIVAGKIGFFAKAVVYGLIGGMTINVTKGGMEDTSPQGAFLLLGNNSIIGIPALVVMAVCLVMYSTWRFSEAATGQGSDATFSKTKNIFKYRVSPAVSGLVYLAYTYYVVRTIFTPADQRHASTASGSTSTTRSSFPDSWSAQGAAGKFGVVFIGLTFLIATITQLQVFFTGSFKRDLYKRKLRNKWFRWFGEFNESAFTNLGREGGGGSVGAGMAFTHIVPLLPFPPTVYTIGHIGFLARAMVFLLVAILMFRSLTVKTGSNSTVTDKATEVLMSSSWGRALLIILGVGLLLYALFAFMNIWLKIFPTPPPSRIAELSGDKDDDNNNQNGAANGVDKENGGFFERFKRGRGGHRGGAETLRV